MKPWAITGAVAAALALLAVVLAGAGETERFGTFAVESRSKQDAVGRWIATVREDQRRGRGGTFLALTAASGRPLMVRLTEPTVRVSRVRPSWAPDGRQLAYVTQRWVQRDTAESFGRDRWAVRVVSVTSRRHRTVYRDAAETSIDAIAWAPDGRHIAVARSTADDGAVVVIDLSGRVVKRLADVQVASLDWSADGRRLAVNRDGRVLIIDLRTGDADEVARATGAPAWSPDGSQLAFPTPQPDAAEDCFEETCIARADIWRQRVDGSARKPIVEGPRDEREPTWSPDGRRIAYITGTDLAVRTVERRDRARHLTPRRQQDQFPVWQP